MLIRFHAPVPTHTAAKVEYMVNGHTEFDVAFAKSLPSESTTL